MRRRVIRGAVAVVAIGGVTAGIMLAPGYDQRTVTPDDAAVWAMQSGDGRRFARVNTAVGELDTVKVVANPSDITSFGGTVLVFANNLGTVSALPAGQVHDLEDTADPASTATPPGTTGISYSGDVVGYVTEDGQVLAGRISDGTAVKPRTIDPYADVTVAKGEQRQQFRADAVAVGADGTVVAYSTTDQQVLVATVDDGSVKDVVPVAGGPTGDVQLTTVGSTWVLLGEDSGTLWVAGRADPVTADLAADPVLQRPSGSGSTAYVADAAGLVSVSLGDGVVARVFSGAEASLGTPAAPTVADGDVTAAWLPTGQGPGTLWTATGSTTALDYGGATLDDSVAPVLRSNGVRTVLNDTVSGWVWDVPGGGLLPSSQAWDTQDQTVVEAVVEDSTKPVTDPRPPVALPDSFGVRQGRQVLLPVLLNDHDANDDPLTIAPASITQPDPAFGTVATADDGQSMVVDVAPGATGSATFSYAVTDGTTKGGLTSDPVTVTMTVHPDGVNEPPVWCGVTDCLATWPSAQLAPGGTTTAEVLSGWVDPDGDPVYVQSAVTDPAVASVAATPDGRVVVQHNDPGATSGGSFAITVTVADARGATASKALNVAVVGATQLSTQSFVVTTTVGVPVTVDLTAHVTGAQGPVVLSDVSLPPTDDATVSSTSGSAGFRVVAPTAGTRFVDYTVTDGLSQVDGVVRIDVVTPEDEKLTAAPVTAFVRAKEDTTVDVLSAVTNPGGYVLLLDDVDWVPSGSSELTVDLVGQSLLRISGSTADGQPGTLGTVTYRATDGSGSAQRSVTGEVTVVLLGADVPPPPLAVDDAVTVRVGEQADIAVLGNDIAPAGHVIALDPSAVVADPSAGLVFPSGRSIRYLAPDVPGVYQVTYGIYVLGYPSQADTATLLLTVLDTSTNAPPTPPGLTGRVLSGASVTIGFSGTGIDPDGDSVALDAIATQPDIGSATISADGTGIVYTSAPGYSGQASFTYQVVDARGATATGTVSVGVLDAERDPSPVTYSDYVQVQVGPDQRVVVEPMANDIDLTGGTLELVDVTADARAGTPEYAALEAQIESVEDGKVTITVGQEPATSAYVYTVRNAGGSTSVGRIVVKAVRERVLDLPVVADTILTAETAEGFTAGVDVVAGSVSWATGDVSGLRLSLWGAPAGVRSSGWVISGRVTDAPQLIAFELTGTNFAGEEVSTYGFLRVPGATETRLALRTSFTAAQVNEDESVDIDLADIMVVPAGDSLVLDTSALRTGGARAAATCTAVQGTTVRYSAGKGAPFTDSCTVSVRLASQKTVTVIPVPVVIIPLQAQPTLLAAALTVSPGATATFDLSKMVSWPKGAETRPVTFATAYRGDQFTVTQTGATVTVVAADTALPGKVEPVTVSLPSDPDTPVVSLSLEVGPAPSELPKGATVSQQCSQASGSSCTITVVGKSGEVNPLPKSALVVSAVQQSAACPAVTFAVSGTGSVTASWPVDASGVVCTTVFAVTDAQGRVSSGDRMGVINLDLQGLPADPQQIKQTAFGDGSLSVTVVGGEAAKSYPAVQGFRVYLGKQVVSTCTATGSCPEITGLTNGAKQDYTVKAFNSVGESRGQASTQAWSYAVPRTPTLSATPVPRGPDGRAATIVVSGLDSSTSKVTISSAAGTSRDVVTNGAPSVTVDGFDVGSNTATTVTVTPYTKFDLPPVAGANAAGGAATVVTNGIGAPGLAADDRTATYTFSADGRRATATLEVQATANGDGGDVLVGIWSGGRCTNTVTASGGRATVTIADLRVNRTSTHELCAFSQRDGVVFAQAPTVRITLRSWQDPGAPKVLSGYQVAASCSPSGAGCAAAQVLQPSVDVPDDATVQFSMDGGASWRSDVALEVGVPTSVIARYCVDLGGGEQRCSSATSPVPAADSTRQYRVGVSDWQCTVGEQPTITIAGPESESSVAWTLLDVNGDETTDLTAMVQARVTVTWNGRVSGVQPWKATQTCAVPPPVDPGG